MRRSVYLVGPITGLSYQGATDWREYAKNFLSNHGIAGLNPLRGKDYLKGEKDIADKYDLHVMSTSRGIMTRDYFDCMNAGVILANFIGAEKVSIGSAMEIAWGYNNHTPVIVCMEDGNPHDHSMIREATGYRVTSLEEGLHIATAILKDYPK
jgi:hypothetical protein